MNVARFARPARAALAVGGLQGGSPKCRCRIPAPSGNSDSSASRIAPEPVPRSAMRNGRSRPPSARNNSSASSTTVSVSGRGTSVAAESCSGSPQNSFSPRMRATGSPARRRRAKSSRRADSFEVSWRCAADDHAGQVEAKCMARQNPRVEFGGSMAGLNAQRAARLDVWREIVMRRAISSRPANAGPIAAACRCGWSTPSPTRGRGVWVPAFAGTTAGGAHAAAPCAASCAAWCSVVSASINSPSASPEITCGNL